MVVPSVRTVQIVKAVAAESALSYAVARLPTGSQVAATAFTIWTVLTLGTTIDRFSGDAPRRLQPQDRPR
jgi:hypothetical protein